MKMESRLGKADLAWMQAHSTHGCAIVQEGAEVVKYMVASVDHPYIRDMLRTKGKVLAWVKAR